MWSFLPPRRCHLETSKSQVAGPGVSRGRLTRDPCAIQLEVYYTVRSVNSLQNTSSSSRISEGRRLYTRHGVERQGLAGLPGYIHGRDCSHGEDVPSDIDIDQIDLTLSTGKEQSMYNAGVLSYNVVLDEYPTDSGIIL